MSGFHQRMRAMVIRQLGPQPRGKGVPVSLFRRTGGEYNPSTGGVDPEVVTEYKGSGVRVNYSEFAVKNAETIQYGDFQIYLSPVQLDGLGEMPTPEVADQMTFLEKKVRVINIEPFNENGFGCGWKVQVRYG